MRSWRFGLWAGRSGRGSRNSAHGPAMGEGERVSRTLRGHPLNRRDGTGNAHGPCHGRTGGPLGRKGDRVADGFGLRRKAQVRIDRVGLPGSQAGQCHSREHDDEAQQRENS